MTSQKKRAQQKKGARAPKTWCGCHARAARRDARTSRLSAPALRAPSTRHLVSQRAARTAFVKLTTDEHYTVNFTQVRNAPPRESSSRSWTIATIARVQPSERGARRRNLEMQLFIVRPHRLHFLPSRCCAQVDRHRASARSIGTLTPSHNSHTDSFLGGIVANLSSQVR